MWLISAITLHTDALDDPDRNDLKCSFVVVLIAAKVFLSCCCRGVHTPYVGTAACVVGCSKPLQHCFFCTMFLNERERTEWRPNEASYHARSATVKLSPLVLRLDLMILYVPHHLNCKCLQIDF